MTSLKNIFYEGARNYKPTITITGPVAAASEGWGGVGTKDIPIWEKPLIG